MVAKVSLLASNCASDLAAAYLIIPSCMRVATLVPSADHTLELNIARPQAVRVVQSSLQNHLPNPVVSSRGLSFDLDGPNIKCSMGPKNDVLCTKLLMDVYKSPTSMRLQTM